MIENKSSIIQSTLKNTKCLAHNLLISIMNFIFFLITSLRGHSLNLAIRAIFKSRPVRHDSSAVRDSATKLLDLLIICHNLSVWQVGKQNPLAQLITNDIVIKIKRMKGQTVKNVHLWLMERQSLELWVK